MKEIGKILLVAALLSYFSGALLGPIYAIFVEKIGGDILDAANAWAIYAIAAGIMTIIFCKIEDNLKFNKNFIIVGGFAIGALATIGYLFVSRPSHLFIVQIMQGIDSATAPQWDAAYSKVLEKNKESTEWSFVEGGSKIIIGIAAILGGLTANFLGFKILFILMSIIEVLATIVAARLLLKKAFRASV